METTFTFRPVLWACCAIFICVTSCGFSPDRYHPHYSEYIRAIDSVLLLDPQIMIFQSKPDGKPVWQEGASQSANRMAEQAVRRLFASKALTVHLAGASPTVRNEIDDIQNLFIAVNRAIQLHTFGPQIFPEKLETFEYGLGPVDNLLKQYQADALVLIRGQQTRDLSQGRDWISMAVVEPAGNIIWYTFRQKRKNSEVQPEDSMLALITSALDGFMEDIR